MGYLFLAISLLAGAAKGYCGKKMGSFAVNVQSAVLLNLLRMSLCVVFGILLVFGYNHTGYLTLNPKAIIISALSGVSTAAFVITWLLSVRKSVYDAGCIFDAWHSYSYGSRIFYIWRNRFLESVGRIFYTHCCCRHYVFIQ